MADIHIHIHDGGGVTSESSSGRKSSRRKSPPRSKTTPAKKRPASRYQKEYGRQFKALKKKHPKTQFKTLSKRAHTATKKKLK